MAGKISIDETAVVIFSENTFFPMSYHEEFSDLNVDDILEDLDSYKDKTYETWLEEKSTEESDANDSGVEIKTEAGEDNIAPTFEDKETQTEPYVPLQKSLLRRFVSKYLRKKASRIIESELKDKVNPMKLIELERENRAMKIQNVKWIEKLSQYPTRHQTDLSIKGSDISQGQLMTNQTPPHQTSGSFMQNITIKNEHVSMEYPKEEKMSISNHTSNENAVRTPFDFPCVLNGVDAHPEVNFQLKSSGFAACDGYAKSPLPLHRRNGVTEKNGNDGSSYILSHHPSSKFRHITSPSSNVTNLNSTYLGSNHYSADNAGCRSTGEKMLCSANIPCTETSNLECTKRPVSNSTFGYNSFAGSKLYSADNLLSTSHISPTGPEQMYSNNILHTGTSSIQRTDPKETLPFAGCRRYSGDNVLPESIVSNPRSSPVYALHNGATNFQRMDGPAVNSTYLLNGFLQNNRYLANNIRPASSLENTDLKKDVKIMLRNHIMQRGPVDNRMLPYSGLDISPTHRGRSLKRGNLTKQEDGVDFKAADGGENNPFQQVIQLQHSSSLDYIRKCMGTNHSQNNLEENMLLLHQQYLQNTVYASMQNLPCRFNTSGAYMTPTQSPLLGFNHYYNNNYVHHYHPY